MRNGILLLAGLLVAATTIVYFSRRDGQRKLVNFGYNEIIGEEIVGKYEVCPNLQLAFSNGRVVNLRDHNGDVLAIRFTRFHPQDLPSLRYLDALYGRFHDEGFIQYFVYVLAKSNKRASFDEKSFFTPVIEDDGYISGQLRARLNDFVLIDRNSNIVVRHNELNDQTIFSLIIRFLYHNSKPPLPITMNQYRDLLMKTSFIDVESERIIQLAEYVRNNSALITFFVSECFVCPIQQRIGLLRNFASKSPGRKHKIIFLFGLGHSLDEIRNWAERADLLARTTVGIIENGGVHSEKGLSFLFKYYINPFSIIIDKKGRIEYSEEPNDASIKNLDFIERHLRLP